MISLEKIVYTAKITTHTMCAWKYHSTNAKQLKVIENGILPPIIVLIFKELGHNTILKDSMYAKYHNATIFDHTKTQQMHYVDIEETF